MASESESNLRLEIGRVLFIDLVGYSKLLIDEQKERLRELTDIVLATRQVGEATCAGLAADGKPGSTPALYERALLLEQTDDRKPEEGHRLL
jgi:hypothetical protein